MTRTMNGKNIRVGGTGDRRRLEENLEDFLAFLDVRPSSAGTYRKGLKQFFGYLAEKRIDRPGREHIAEWRDWLGSVGKRPSTVASYLVAARLFFRWARQQGLYPDIAERVRGPRIGREHKRDALTIPQVVATLGGIDRGTLKGLRDYAILSVMVTGGLRCVEVARARIMDFRPLRGRTVLYVQGKGRDEHGAEYVKMPGHVEDALRAYLNARGPAPANAPLFASTSNQNRDGPLSSGAVSWIVKRAMRGAGYNDSRLTAHSLRHTAVTLALLGGESLEAVKDFARHSSVNTTLIYSHAIARENNTCEDTIAAAIFSEAAPGKTHVI